MSNGWFGVLWGATPAVGIGRLFGVKAWLCEIKQVFRQLLQLLNVQGREYFAAVLIEAHKTSAELGHGQCNGFLLPTCPSPYCLLSSRNSCTGRVWRSCCSGHPRII
jgi:hypothetical protein